MIDVSVRWKSWHIENPQTSLLVCGRDLLPARGRTWAQLLEANLYRTTGALIIALSTSGVALAQQIPPPKFECGSFVARDGAGKYGEAVEVQVTRANSTPPMSDDYMIVGGTCDFQAHDAVPDMVRIQWQKSIPNGYSCKAGPAGSTSFVTTTATLYACRIVAQPVEVKPIDPTPTATKPYGELAVIARRGTAFQKPLKYDYRVCNVDAVSGINVAWYDQATGATPTGPNAKPVPAGSCMELNEATYIHIQASNPADPTLRIYYNRFPQNSFARGVRVVAMPPGAPQLPAPGTPPAGAKPMTAQCADIPSVKGGPRDQTFERKCQVPLPDWGSYRICFSENVVDRAGGDTQHWWPAKYLPMIVDPKLIGVPISQESPNDARWNDVLPNTCRDYYDVVQAYVLVGGDSNYRAKDVLAVHMTVAPLK